jgi:tRNA modification GTPase
VIDEGIALYFPGPHSYSGEDVLELQGHGGPVVLQMILRRCLVAGKAQGLRIAEPGEFTRRAFLNDKIDLLQAEAVADLIEASTEAAARSAQASLHGAFSEAVQSLVGALTKLRLLVEATLDFPEEEIEFLKSSDALGQLERIRQELRSVLERTRQGALLRDGVKVVLAGRPNVGKSSLLNALAGAEVAIVTAIPGTTRDRIAQAIQIEGVALHIIDTAGLRATSDPIEIIGIERSWREIEGADIILNLRDAREPQMAEDFEIASRFPPSVPLRSIFNKIDLTGESARIDGQSVYVSALTGAGMDLLRQEILRLAGWQALGETAFLGRQRHLEALQAADLHLGRAAAHAGESDRALDLYAEELRLAQEELGQITGELTSDELLGEIFGRFCIGK